MCDRVIYGNNFMLKYYRDIYKTQKICNEVTDDCLGALKVIVCFDKDSSKVEFLANEMGILGVDLDKINLDVDNRFYEDDPGTTTNVRILAWRNIFEKCKALERDISNGLMSVAWHG